MHTIRPTPASEKPKARPKTVRFPEVEEQIPSLKSFLGALRPQKSILFVLLVFTLLITLGGVVTEFFLEERKSGDWWHMVVIACMVLHCGVVLWTLWALGISRTRLAAEHVRYIAIAESEKNFRNLCNTIPVMVWTSGLEGQAEFANHGWLNFRGKDDISDLHTDWQNSLHPEDRAWVVEMTQQHFQAHQPFSIEYRLKNAEGEYRSILSNGVPRRDENGLVIGFVGSLIDVSDLRAAEELATTSGLRFETLCEHANVGIYHIDPTGKCDFINSALRRIANYPTGSPADFSVLHMIPEDEREQLIRAWSEARAAWKPFTSTCRLIHPDGRVVHVISSATPIVNAKGQPISYIGTVTDITETVEDKQRISAALSYKEQLYNREVALKRELDHRVRNNLAGLLGLVSLYERSVRSPDLFAAAIREKVLAMKEAHDLIASSRGEGILLSELINRLISTAAPHTGLHRIALHGSKVRLSPNEASPFAVIFQELATNSRKYGALSSTDGRLAVSWNTVSTPAGPRLCLEWVEDFQRPQTPRKPEECASTGVGLDLIRGFATSDLGGECEIGCESGRWFCRLTVQVAALNSTISSSTRDGATPSLT